MLTIKYRAAFKKDYKRLSSAKKRTKNAHTLLTFSDMYGIMYM